MKKNNDNILVVGYIVNIKPKTRNDSLIRWIKSDDCKSAAFESNEFKQEV